MWKEIALRNFPYCVARCIVCYHTIIPSSISAMHFLPVISKVSALVKSMALVLSYILLLPLLNPITHGLYSHPLFGFRKSPANADKCQWVHFFPVWNNSVTQQCFIYAFMSDAILTDCHSEKMLRH